MDVHYKKMNFNLFWLLLVVVLQSNISSSANSGLEVVVIERTNICENDFYTHQYGQSICAVNTTELTLIETFGGNWTFLDSYRRPYSFYEKTYINQENRNWEDNLYEYYYSRNGDWVPYKLNIHVKYSELETIPPGIVHRAVLFNASHLDIKTISYNDFASAEHLKELDLSFNGISYVPRFAFYWPIRLETLDLSHNKISDILPNAFRSGRVDALNIVNIERIYLNHNRITKLQDNVFPEGMLYLTLNDNQIVEIGILPTRTLQTLILDNNNALSVIPNLNVMYISLQNTSATELIIYQSTIDINATDSAIQHVQIMGAGAFQLQTLNLRNNSLTTLSWIAPLTNLEILDVSLNQLEQIDESVLSTLTSLRQLNVSSNNLLQFDQQFLQHTTNLQYLDLSYNKLGSFQLEQEAANLEVLGIAGLGLVIVDTNLRQMAPRLRSIRINNNNWTCQHLFVSLLLLHYDGIMPIDDTLSLNISESPGIGYVRGIRCLQPLSNYNDTIGKRSSTLVYDCKTDVDNVVNQKWNDLLKNIQEALENKLKELSN